MLFSPEGNFRKDIKRWQNGWWNESGTFLSTDMFAMFPTFTDA